MMNLKSLICCVALVCLTQTALLASGTFHFVSPDEATKNGFDLSLEVDEVAGDKIRFRAHIKEAGGRFSSKPGLSLSKVVHVEASHSSVRPVQDLEPRPERGEIRATFEVGLADLKDPQLCLVFANYAEVEIDGKVVPMPSVDFVIFRLRDHWEAQKEAR